MKNEDENREREGHRFAEAIAPLKAVLAGGAQRPNTWYYLGLSLLEIGQNDEAIVALKSTLKLEPTHPHALAALVKSLQDADRNAEAGPYRDQLIRVRARN